MSDIHSLDWCFLLRLIHSHFRRVLHSTMSMYALVQQQLNIPRSISSLVQFIRPFANKAFSIDRHTTTSLQTCIIFVANNKFFHIEFQSDLIYSRGYIKLLPMQLELSAQCGQMENFQIWIIIHWSMSWNFQKVWNSTASYKSTERANKTLGKLTQKKFK